MKGVKPLTTIAKVDLISGAKQLSTKNVHTLALEEQDLSSDDFSDHEYLDVVNSETIIEFVHYDFSIKALRRLRHGREPIEAVLDLHGKKVEAARIILHQFLLDCLAAGVTQTLIIHGKGRGNKPILKNKLNHWLRQTDKVLAFCSAQPKDGGLGALYVRLRKRK